MGPDREIRSSISGFDHASSGVASVAAFATAGIVLFGGNGGSAGHGLAERVVSGRPSDGASAGCDGPCCGSGCRSGPRSSLRRAPASLMPLSPQAAPFRGADLSALNLASAVRDGDRIVVPAMGDDPRPQPGAAAGDGRVRVNAATTSELEALPGVGPVLARRIVEHREAHGAFR